MALPDPTPVYRISCPVCKNETTLDDVHRISDISEEFPWDRVRMGCGHESTLRAEDVENITAVAAGLLACAVFPDPDSSQFITVFARGRIE
jgi:hypothetical protein